MSQRWWKVQVAPLSSISCSFTDTRCSTLWRWSRATSLTRSFRCPGASSHTNWAAPPTWTPFTARTPSTSTEPSSGEHSSHIQCSCTDIWCRMWRCDGPLFPLSGVCWRRKPPPSWTSSTASSVWSWSSAGSWSHSPGSSSRGSRCIPVSSPCSSPTTPSSITPASCSKVSCSYRCKHWKTRVLWRADKIRASHPPLQIVTTTWNHSIFLIFLDQVDLKYKNKYPIYIYTFFSFRKCF